MYVNYKFSNYVAKDLERNIVLSIRLYSFFHLDLALVDICTNAFCKLFCDILCGNRAVKSAVSTVAHYDLYLNVVDLIG